MTMYDQAYVRFGGQFEMSWQKLIGCISRVKGAFVIFSADYFLPSFDLSVSRYFWQWNICQLLLFSGEGGK